MTEPNSRSAYEPDGERMRAEAAEIAFPRYPGTPGDPRARAILRRRFDDAGLEVGEEFFSYDIRHAFRAIRLTLTASAALVVAASVLSAWSPWGAFGVLLIGIALGGTLVLWAPGAEKLYARPGPTRTANVSGTRRARGTPRLTLIVLAHHDSKSQSLTYPFRIGFTLIALLSSFALLLLLVVGLALGRFPGGPVLAGVVGGLAAVAMLALSTMTSGNESPGGVDNAGSVAIVCELARSLPPAIDDDIELIFLSPGAEEDHMVGAMRWLDEHRANFRDRPVYAINFDAAGAPGLLVMLERYGFGKRFSPELSRGARAAARRLGLPLRGIWLPPGVGIDAIPFDHRGVPCLTFASGSPGPVIAAIHSAGDVADNLDPGNLARIARLAHELARDVCLRAPAE
ncbi:MAG: Zn-dependent exopeptidase M28 [bacterium]|nr:Zn-dependent exopeptidase M28 [bacterium]